MKSLNIVHLIGNLGSKPEFKEIKGKLVSKFSIATNDEWLDKKTMNRRVNTQWHKIVCFNKLAEITKDYLDKGSRVYVAGKLKTSQWQGPNNENKVATEIVIEELIILDSKFFNKEKTRVDFCLPT